MRDNGMVQNRAVYVAIGVNLEGHKDVLGLWTSANEGAKFWLQVLTEMRNRGVADVFIACVDGLKGFPEAIETVFPPPQVQLCIVHLPRQSLHYVSWKQRRAVAADLKPMYAAPAAEEAVRLLDDFAAKWEAAYPTIARVWRRNWERITPFFAFPGAEALGDALLCCKTWPTWTRCRRSLCGKRISLTEPAGVSGACT